MKRKGSWYYGPKKRIAGVRPQTKGNTMMGPQRYPLIKRKGAQVRIRHSEFICEVFPAKGAFANGLNSFKLNPNGLASVKDASGANVTIFVCPWLRRIAQNFEEWNPRMMRFRFVSNCSDVTVAATSSGMGSVVMATQYNVNAPDFKSKQEMEAYTGAQSTKPSRNLTHYVNCKDRKSPLANLYVRRNDVDTKTVVEDARFYDLGEFILVTTGNSLTTGEASGADAKLSIGELHIDYDIDFFKTCLPVNVQEENQGLFHDHITEADILLYGPTFTTPTTSYPMGSLLKFPNPSNPRRAGLGGRIVISTSATEADQPEELNGDDSLVVDGAWSQPYTAGSPRYYFPVGTKAGDNFQILWLGLKSAGGFDAADQNSLMVPTFPACPFKLQVGTGAVSLIRTTTGESATSPTGNSNYSTCMIHFNEDVTNLNADSAWIAIVNLATHTVLAFDRFDFIVTKLNKGDGFL